MSEKPYPVTTDVVKDAFLAATLTSAQDASVTRLSERRMLHLRDQFERSFDSWLEEEKKAA